METQPTDATRQAQAKAERLALSFATVFGNPSARTDAQKLVIEHLSICAGDEGNSYRFHEAKDGIALIAAGIHRDGAKSLLRVIDRQVDRAAQVGKEPPAKPKTTKRK
jgi:hypothetical protein